ncbi:MAG: saccharopine dehydrogenase C-terminal domain-containing protein [Candidatus Thermoplasmatota archaeon]
MNVVVCGAGMMGRAIAYDLIHKTSCKSLTLVDIDRKNLSTAQKFFSHTDVHCQKVDVSDVSKMKNIFKKADIAISAVPYYLNYRLTKLALQTRCHFVDLGGNNDVVMKQRTLNDQAKKQDVTVIPDCGLAPGLVSIITRDIVDELDRVDRVHLRVGGLPVSPQPPLNYQIVFSPYGLINEYYEDALILDHGVIRKKPSLSELENIMFPAPFGKMEAFLTSGGCSTLPYTFQDRIGYLDYKTIRYPGHCEQMQTLFHLGFADPKKQKIAGCMIAPREVLVTLLQQHVPTQGKDVVLLYVLGNGEKQGKNITMTYTMIDYADETTEFSAMMRTTGFPAAITAQMIMEGMISERGVFCSEENIPSKPFFSLLAERGLHLEKKLI